LIPSKPEQKRQWPVSSLPLWDDLRNYSRPKAKGDVQAGLTLGILLIPQAMAYAMLAGLPAVYGLYAALVPMIVYALFGTSRHLTLGPAALMALLVFSGVSALADPGTPAFIELAIALSAMVGGMLLVLGLFRLGFLVQFLSLPVIGGFTSAAALLIVFSQIRALTGFELAETRTVQGMVKSLIALFSNPLDWSFATGLVLGVSALSLGFLWSMERWLPRWPAALILVFLGLLLSMAFDAPSAGLPVLGFVPSGLPAFQLPQWQPNLWRLLLPSAAGIALMGFVQSYAVAKGLQKRDRSYNLDANQELIAQGIANLAGSAAQAFPAAGSLSRSAVVFAAGGRTGVASLVGGAVVVLALLFLTPILRYLPEAILAAIIVVSSLRLIVWREVQLLWSNDRSDFWMWVATAASTLVFGIEAGILIGVFLSLAVVIRASSRPHYAVLGRLPGTTIYKNTERFAAAEEEEGVLIIRLDARLYFANRQYVREALERELELRPETELLIIDSVSISMIDSSAMAMLKHFQRECERKGIRLRFLGLIGPVRDIFRRNGMDSAIGEDHIYMRIHDAVDEFRAEQRGQAWSGPAARQHTSA
jgi:SulP family sulfate permease